MIRPVVGNVPCWGFADVFFWDRFCISTGYGLVHEGLVVLVVLLVSLQLPF